MYPFGCDTGLGKVPGSALIRVPSLALTALFPVFCVGVEEPLLGIVWGGCFTALVAADEGCEEVVVVAGGSQGIDATLRSDNFLRHPYAILC